MTLSVASVTVAYNPARFLPRQIEALLRQTRPLQEIVVVDNASSDDTCELLAERYPQVTVLKMSENLGMGGALAAGLAYAALEKQHDWVWTFDGDSMPDDRALQALLEGADSLGNAGTKIGMVAPLPVHAESGIPYPPLLWDDGFVKPSCRPTARGGMVCRPRYQFGLYGPARSCGRYRSAARRLLYRLR